MASNVNFRELSNRFNMLTLVEATGTEIVHSAYSASQVENMNNMRMRDHAPEELDELNRRLVQIDSETGDLMKKMKELHEEMNSTMRGIADLRRERLDVEQDIEVMSTNMYIALGANIAVYQAAQLGYDAGMGDRMPPTFRIGNRQGLAPNSASSAGPASAPAPAPPPDSQDRQDSRRVHFAPAQVQGQGGGHSSHSSGPPPAPPPQDRVGSSPNWPDMEELKEHRRSNRVWLPPLEFKKETMNRGRGAAGHRFALSEAEIKDRQRSNRLELVDLMPNRIIDIQDLADADIDSTVWLKSVNNMLGEEEFVHRILTCDHRWPLYGTHISGYKIGYRFEQDYDQEVYSGMMYIGCANEVIADRFVQYWDGRQFEKHSRLRVQASIANRPLSRDGNMGNRARTPGYTRTTWEEIWALRTDVKRRRDMV